MAAKKVYKVSRNQVLTDPVFEFTRQNNAEFSRAGMANRLLRHALHLVLKNVADRYVSGRLTKLMMKVLKSDPVNGRGERRVTMGELSILEGFNFNRTTSLQQVFHAPYTVSYDHSAGKVDIHIPLFIPQSMVDGPAGAGAFSMIGIAAAIDFEADTADYFEPVQTDIYELNSNARQSIHLPMSVPVDNPYPVVVCLGVEFCTNDNGQYGLIEKQHHAMAIVKVFPSPTR